MSIGVPAYTRTGGSRRSAVPTSGASQPQGQPRARLRALAWIAMVLLLPVAVIVGAIHLSNTHTSAASRAAKLPVRFIIHPHTITQTAQVGALRARLTVYPVVPGANHFVLSLRDGVHLLAAAAVSLQVSMPGMAMQPLIYQAHTTGPGRYQANGALSMFGQWRVIATIEQPHTASLHAAFAVPLDLPPSVLRALAGAAGR